MQKTIRKVDVEQGIIQITTVDERWYIKGEELVPSVTWICNYYPKGVAFYQWLAKHGWDESQAIKKDAADKGSKVHYAVEDLIAGKKVKMDSKYYNQTTGQDEELTVQEYECLMSFVKWFKDVKPEIILNEQTGFAERFAGTIDLICKIKGELFVVDFKTSQYIWPSHELQLSAYKRLPVKGIDLSEAKLAVLQLGYRRNKNGYKFTEVEDKFHLFESTYEIWKNETAGQKPFQKDYPTSLVLSENSEGSTDVPKDNKNATDKGSVAQN